MEEAQKTITEIQYRQEVERITSAAPQSVADTIMQYWKEHGKLTVEDVKACYAADDVACSDSQCQGIVDNVFQLEKDAAEALFQHVGVEDQAQGEEETSENDEESDPGPTPEPASEVPTGQRETISVSMPWTEEDEQKLDHRLANLSRELVVALRMKADGTARQKSILVEMEEIAISANGARFKDVVTLRGVEGGDLVWRHPETGEELRREEAPAQQEFDVASEAVDVSENELAEGSVTYTDIFTDIPMIAATELLNIFFAVGLADTEIDKVVMAHLDGGTEYEYDAASAAVIKDKLDSLDKSQMQQLCEHISFDLPADWEPEDSEQAENVVVPQGVYEKAYNLVANEQKCDPDDLAERLDLDEQQIMIIINQLDHNKVIALIGGEEGESDYWEVLVDELDPTDNVGSEVDGVGTPEPEQESSEGDEFKT